MPEQKKIHFSEGMMRIRKLSTYKDKNCFVEYINAINSIRSNYQLAQKTYDENTIGDVYLISCDRTSFGFFECTYKNMDLDMNNKVTLFLHELHIAPYMHNKGVGKAVLKHLLAKGLAIEMVVANVNLHMLTLVNKFDVEHKHIAANTRTIIIKP